MRWNLIKPASLAFNFNLLLLCAFSWLAVSYADVSSSSVGETEVKQINTNKANDLEGVWRGVLEIQKGVFLTIGLNIEGESLTLDSPNQGVYGRIPTELQVAAQKVEFKDQGLSAEYQGQLQDGKLVGKFKQNRTFQLVLERLTEADLARFAYEGAYLGELQVNKRNQLPLQLNIAVLHQSETSPAYLATLDSPLQKSYGIPITELVINSKRLSFKSPMIQAQFSGEQEGDTEFNYQGTFIQGQAMPLTLKKKE